MKVSLQIGLKQVKKEIKNNGEFLLNIGNYERLYPDDLSCSTKGFIELSLREVRNCMDNYIYYIFEIYARENNTTLEDDNFQLYHSFGKFSELLKYVKKFISKYKTKKELFQYVKGFFRYIL